MNESVVIERQELTIRLKERIEFAYEHRYRMNYNPKTMSTKEVDESAERRAKNIEQHSPEDIVEFGQPPPNDWEVSVDNSHDYKLLLELAVNFFLERKLFDRIELAGIIEETLIHEFEHHVPGLGQEGLQIKYSLQFFEDIESRCFAYRPIISLFGKTSYGILTDMIESARNPSHTDKTRSTS